MNIRILSDLHLEFNDILLEPGDEDLLVLAGDISSSFEESTTKIDTYLSLGGTIIFVLGNHDYYNKTIEETIKKYKEYSSSRPKFHFLENESIVLGDIRFFGCTLWTDINCDKSTKRLLKMYINDFRCINGINIPNILEKHSESKKIMLDTLNNSQEKVIIITHFLPSYKSIHKDYKDSYINSYFASRDMSECINHKNCMLWIHGHTHKSIDYVDENTRVICNPFGYSVKENKDFNKFLTINTNDIYLKNPCKYSFDDLMLKSETFIEKFNELSQEDKNIIVKDLCRKIGWKYQDIYRGNIVYISFSGE